MNIIDFNKNWFFQKEGGKEEIVNLPHDAMIHETRYPNCRSGKDGAFFPGGKYCYRKEFSVPSSWIGKEIQLFFEGVYRNASIYLNGELIRYHRYGYSEFSADISSEVRIGANQIRVMVDNSLIPNCRWYSGSGIYRPVHLLVSSKDCPRNLEIETLSLSGKIQVTCNKASLIQVFDSKGMLVAEGKPGILEIPSPHLWTCETPYLYRAVASNDKDSVEDFFGIRLLHLDAENGLQVNGKRVLLRGCCIHQDGGCLGAGEYPDSVERKIRILKGNGFNAIRVSHNPASRLLLSACDRLGMYVLDEAFDGWYIPKNYHDFARDFFEEYEETLKGMARKDFNHPSVLMYSIGNEVTETATEKGVNLASQMRDILHEEDKTRPVTCGINVLLNVYASYGIGVYSDKKEYRKEKLPENGRYREKKTGSSFFNMTASRLGKLMFYLSKGRRAGKMVDKIASSLDVVGLNYAASRYDIDVRRCPGRIMLGTESMAADLPYNWERVKKYPNVLGDFVWAGWDYLGEACIGDWTYYSYPGLPLFAGQGMIDSTGYPLASMEFIKTVWGLRHEPYIVLSPLNHASETPKKGAWQFTNGISSYNWRGYENRKAKVEVYSDAFKIRLLLNGKKIGEKKTKDFRACFSIRYQNGVLEAAGLDEKGKVLSSSSLRTGEGKNLVLKADKRILRSGTEDLCYLEISFEDDTHQILPSVEQDVKIQLEGDSVNLLGMQSGLCKTSQSFFDDHYRSYRGRLLAVFQADKAGITKVRVSSSDVAEKEITIEVKD